jgi:hypothetical protein
VYAWIWNHIPFKRWELKTLVSLLLAAGFAALLWYQVFPAVEPILPFDDVQVENLDGTTPEEPAPSDPAPTGANPTGTNPARPTPTGTNRGPLLPS